MATHSARIVPQYRNHLGFLFWSPQEPNEPLIFATDEAQTTQFAKIDPVTQTVYCNTFAPMTGASMVVGGVTLNAGAITASSASMTTLETSSYLKTNQVIERSVGNGVLVDDISLKDGSITRSVPGNMSIGPTGNHVLFINANGDNQLIFSDGFVRGATDNDVDLGHPNYYFKNSYVNTMYIGTKLVPPSAAAYAVSGSYTALRSITMPAPTIGSYDDAQAVVNLVYRMIATLYDDLLR